MKAFIPQRIFAFSFLVFSLLAFRASAQNGIIQGRVFDDVTNAPLEFAAVQLQGTTLGSFTDSVGRFTIKGLTPGLYNVQVKFSGYRPAFVNEVQVTNSKPVQLEIALAEDNQTDSVLIVASPFKQVEESPVSLRSIGTSEIQRSPGGNRDISRVVQSLPGVANTAGSFRNDLFIRGGGPGENRFYLDGIEIPNINHFATQGASGGPLGLLNVDFIGNVDFYSGAFPANRGNALSSVFEFQQRPARTDRFGFTATLGASEVALSAESPIGASKKGELMVSARRSYLGFLFGILGLPFLPTYNDYQVRYKHRFNQRHELSVMTLGAIDRNSLNTDIVNPTETQQYILDFIPTQNQISYTVGASYKYYGDKGFWQVVLSRSYQQNSFEKYRDNIKFDDNDQIIDSNRVQDIASSEAERRLRIERTARSGAWKWNYGIGVEDAVYTTDNFLRPSEAITINYNTRLRMLKYGAFGQLSRKLLADRLTLSVGLRADGTAVTALQKSESMPTGFAKQLNNPFNQLSPRFSASYLITPELSASFNAGIFHQLPAYTVLGYRSNTGAYTNLAENGIKYITNRHIVGGIAYTAKTNTRISVEGYLKQYENYPFLLQQQLSLANLGSDFGVFGNQPATPASNGRTYGVEVLVQQRMFKGFYGILAYTFGVSQFSDDKGRYTYSSWDNRHIVNLAVGKKFLKTWEAGVRFRYLSGAPYTPVDTIQSSKIGFAEYNVQGVLDFANNLNTARIPSFYQIDMRVDKKFYFKNWSLNTYFDLQNATGNVVPGAPSFALVKDANGNYEPNPARPGYYKFKFLSNDIGTVLPTIGIVVSY